MGKGSKGNPASWEVVLSDGVRAWLARLAEDDMTSATLVRAAINVLRDDGPGLGRPLVDTIKGSSIRNLKELRPGSSGQSEIRILFVFDPLRQAMLLVAGDKQGNWNKWYNGAIEEAEDLYAEYLATLKKGGTK
jgi:hypothetical protein